MSQTMQMHYDSTYHTLLSQRMHYIQELEKISTQIADLKKEARKESIILCEPAQRKSLIDQEVS